MGYLRRNLSGPEAPQANITFGGTGLPPAEPLGTCGPSSSGAVAMRKIKKEEEAVISDKAKGRNKKKKKKRKAVISEKAKGRNKKMEEGRNIIENVVFNRSAKDVKVYKELDYPMEQMTMQEMMEEQNIQDIHVADIVPPE